MFTKMLVSIKHAFEYVYFKILPKPVFYFDNKKYSYYYAMYNATWTAERKIELPIFADIVKNAHGDVLEVGNVLKHYFPFKHQVLDKYEKYPGVINEDVVDFKPKRRYDLIVSISTLEHVGWDEEVKDAGKIEKSIKNLIRLLKPKGKLVFSVPMKYNPYLDELLENPTFGVRRRWELDILSQGLHKYPPKKICIIEVVKN